MEDTISSTTTISRCAVVTGGSKGLGFGICSQLASNGITVVLTARNEEKGIKAVERLKTSGLPNVIFHQLDVQDYTSIASLAKFVETKFGKLDILVNNAAETGLIMDYEAFLTSIRLGGLMNDEKAELVKEVIKESYEKAEGCVKTNYMGTKQVTKALLPLLQLSNSARIVNITSIRGQLKFIENEQVREELGSNIERLTEGRLDEIVLGFLEDFKCNRLKANGWPITGAAYKVSKAAVNALTRLLAKELFPNILVNCVHPGYVQTDATFNTGNLTPGEAAKSALMLALLPNHGPSGLFFDGMHPSTF